TIETPDGHPIAQPHIPHRLVARNSTGHETSLTVLIKTQGSDTKLVAQMQPYYTAKTLAPMSINGVSIPPLVTQISDGENGGVMMNEFPSAFKRAWYEAGQAEQGRTGTVGINGTEYLELLEAAGVKATDFPICQAVGQARLWQQIGSAAVTPTAVTAAIEALKQQDDQFVMEGGSWTNDRSWVSGYQNVLQPMEQLSAQFHEAVAAVPVSLQTALGANPTYQNALLHNLLLQTSCFRYWGQGTWTDYAREIHRRGLAILQQGF
ncbi:MAG: glycosyl hydrolase family 57, partial [Cyanobacteria bacterium P01_F01_bin.4]